MEGTSFTRPFALFNKSYLDLIRSSLILTPFFNFFFSSVEHSSVAECGKTYNYAFAIIILFEQASKHLDPIL